MWTMHLCGLGPIKTDSYTSLAFELEFMLMLLSYISYMHFEYVLYTQIKSQNQLRAAAWIGLPHEARMSFSYVQSRHKFLTWFSTTKFNSKKSNQNVTCTIHMCTLPSGQIMFKLNWKSAQISACKSRDVIRNLIKQLLRNGSYNGCNIISGRKRKSKTDLNLLLGLCNCL